MTVSRTWVRPRGGRTVVVAGWLYMNVRVPRRAASRCTAGRGAGRRLQPDLRAVLTGLQHSRGHHYGIQTAGTAAGDDADGFVFSEANWHGLDKAARPPQHTGDALHRIVERQGNNRTFFLISLATTRTKRPLPPPTAPRAASSSAKTWSSLWSTDPPQQQTTPTGRPHAVPPADHSDVCRSLKHAPACRHPDQADGLTC